MGKVYSWKTSLYDDFWKDWENPATFRKEVAYSIENEDEKFLIKYALPGVEKDDLELTIQRNILMVELKKDTTFVSAFTNNLKLDTFDEDTIKTNLVNGVLEIHMEKKAMEKPKKLKI